ncbi:MAG: UvrD-helicase domain-containing protein, partial [Planctomycetes bacterium]|nr:UvrD-helicase domain-containing protein [Planctomycetota bacterium]
SARLLEVYAEERAGRLDFAELEIAAIKLLTEDKKIREEVQSRSKFLLIDEFKDTNPTQEKLFRCLMSKNDPRGRFFAVGDAKQAIYGFRRSDVRIFKSFEKKVKEDNHSLANQSQKLAWGMTFNDAQPADVKSDRQSGIIKLVKNYRTVSETLNAGNLIFNDLFTVDDRKDYDPEPQDMEVGNETDSPDKPVEVHILEKGSSKQGEEKDGDRANNRDAEATFIATKILDLKNNHGLEFKDITILVRRATRNHVYRKVFARAGIPLLVRGEVGLFKTQEALDCINLLRVLARPTDDIALMGLLRSTFVGVTDTWLTRMGMETNRKTGLHLRVVAQQENAPDEHIASFLDLYKNLRQRAGRDTPAALMQEAIAETGYLLAVQNGPASEQRKANVQRIVDLIRELQAHLPSLAILVRDLETRAANEDPEAQGVPEGSFEGVELMTIHKSKGLAFSTVFIPDMGMVSSGGMFPPMICELPDEGGQLGLRLPRFDDARRGQQRPDLEGWLADTAADLRSTSEKKRVLYVAFTRAIERVIMVGSCGKSLKTGSWASQLLEPYGISDHGDEKPENLPFEFSWPETPDRLPGHSGEKQIAALKAAYDRQSVNLSAEIDSSLVAPLVKAAPASFSHNHEAAEFGLQLHAELEKRIRCNSKSVEFGIVSLNSDLTRQADNGIAALSTLSAAKELPEFGVITAEGRRRIDLLREVGGGHFQIVDYKSDAVTLNDVEAKAEEHRQQLEGYRVALTTLLESRGEPISSIELFVCFTAPEDLQPEERLVKLN